MKTNELEYKFDENKEDILDAFDISKAKRVNQEQKRVNVDFPIWMVESFDKEAKRLGVTRQALIKFWMAEKLEAI